MKRTALDRSAGTRWPRDVADAIRLRDAYECVGPLIGMPGSCQGQPEKDHIRASGGISMKSRSTLDNGVLLCANVHHPMKTHEGRKWRPKLIEYVDWMASHRRMNG